MLVNPAAVGLESGPHPVRWCSRDAMIYALGVGAGSDDPAQELAFTTENSAGIAQATLPTFCLSLQSAPLPDAVGTFDRGNVVHGDQSLTLHQSLPPDGAGVYHHRIDAIHDKGSGALVYRTSRLTAADGRLLATSRMGQFIRGAGGFGGDPGPKLDWTAPLRPPDHRVEQQTRTDQALLYRLCGDRNPLHSDPAFALQHGFAKPILHGLCSLGFVGRAILALAGQDTARFRSLKLRFSAPVIPGERLRTDFWIDGGSIRFRTFVGDRVVLDAGEADIVPTNEPSVTGSGPAD